MVALFGVVVVPAVIGLEADLLFEPLFLLHLFTRMLANSQLLPFIDDMGGAVTCRRAMTPGVRGLSN